MTHGAAHMSAAYGSKHFYFSWKKKESDEMPDYLSLTKNNELFWFIQLYGRDFVFSKLNLPVI